MDRRRLALFVNPLLCGHHEAAWRTPGAQPERIHSPDYYAEIARIAEKGRFDAMFMADFFAFNPAVKYSPRWELEPVTLFAAIARATSNLGFIATGSAIFADPVEIARTFATLDGVTGGRAAWNIVTSGDLAAAANYGFAAPIPHRERYRLGAEATSRVLALWDGIAEAPGEAPVPRPVQGRPVLVQAGSSPDGRDFAARFAEVVFSAQWDMSHAQAFRRDLRARAVAHGRDPNSIRIVLGLAPTIAGTQAEARAKKQALDDLIVPAASLAWLDSFGIDLSAFDFDAPLPRRLGDIDLYEGIKSRFAVISDLADSTEPLTIRQLAGQLAGSRGHLSVVGTAEQVADTIEAWFTAEAVDGFMIMPQELPGDFSVFVDEVVPLLRRRGLVDADYRGSTLRDNLGLPLSLRSAGFDTSVRA
ncbi:LLM class flavin-dependent oxidoreductase [Xanthobacter sediminis]|uniref:LLM class flavin-dependent oxidoreductase n=1 Tax=Xanthobacter sediminis TaxID=3119926 RepID=UPI00372AAF73